MGENQKGFKSPVYRMNMKMKRTIRGQLREGDRSWEGRLGDCLARSAHIGEAKPQTPKG